MKAGIASFMYIFMPKNSPETYTKLAGQSRILSWTAKTVQEHTAPQSTILSWTAPQSRTTPHAHTHMYYNPLSIGESCGEIINRLIKN
jgi:hypothetical protein